MGKSAFMPQALPATPAIGSWPWPPILRASIGWHAAAIAAAVLVPGAAPWALGAIVLNHAVITAAGLTPRSRLLGPNITRLPPAAAARREIAITIDDGPDPEVTPQVLEEVTGQRPACFRAPAGLRNPFLAPVLHRMGLVLVSWTRRGFDTREGSATKVLARLTRGLDAGDILLLHDGHAARTEGGRAVVLEVLPPLLERLRTEGLRAVTLPEGLRA